MASVRAIEAVGEGIARHLRRAWDLGPLASLSCDFKLVGTKDMKALQDNSATCGIYLYRVTHNEYTRNCPQVAALRPAVVDLHYLFGVWHDTASREHSVLGWLLRELSRYPVLDAGMLLAGGAFVTADRLQFVPAELSLDDTAKLWQLLNTQFRPSLTYIVRNVQIAPEDAVQFAPVVATRYEYDDDPQVVEGAGA
jgi:hypothetical protein